MQCNTIHGSFGKMTSPTWWMTGNVVTPSRYKGLHNCIAFVRGKHCLEQENLVREVSNNVETKRLWLRGLTECWLPEHQADVCSETKQFCLFWTLFYLFFFAENTYNIFPSSSLDKCHKNILTSKYQISLRQIIIKIPVVIPKPIWIYYTLIYYN